MFTPWDAPGHGGGRLPRPVLAVLALNAVPAAAQDGGSRSTPQRRRTLKVTGPVGNVGRRGHPISASLTPLAARRLRRAGARSSRAPPPCTARRASGAPTGGGRSPACRSEPYRTRLLVRRPADPARFSGTVVVSWLNVGAGFDLDPEWIAAGRRARARRRRLRRRVRAVARRGGPAGRAALGPGALRIAHPPRRRPRLRHLHAGRPGDRVARRGRPARGALARPHPDRHGRRRSRRSAS